MRRIMALGMLLGTLILTGAGCFGGGKTSDPAKALNVTLRYWRVIDGEDAFSDVIDAYRRTHPYVNIEYKKLRLEDYEAELVRAMAAGEGPDIFTIHNDKLREYEDLILPMPTKVTVKNLVSQGTIRKETVLISKDEPMLSLRALRDMYVDAVTSDIVKVDGDKTSVLGLPLSVDVLALFSNKDLLNAAGIAEPPKYWSELQDDVAKLTKIDQKSGKIIQSGVALGTAGNVDRAPDILTTLMLQNGTRMVDDRGNIAFTAKDPNDREVVPALGALEVYTDFANPTKVVYTWNGEYPNSVEAFANQQTAFMLGYSYHLPLIKAANPKLRFAVTALPTPGPETREVSLANFWVEAVSKNTKNPNEAWSFLNFMAQPDNAAMYLKAARKPPAHRRLIATQADDLELAPFAARVLTAVTWYHGLDADAKDRALKELIDNAVNARMKLEDALTLSAKVISQTYRK